MCRIVTAMVTAATISSMILLFPLFILPWNVLQFLFLFSTTRKLRHVVGQNFLAISEQYTDQVSAHPRNRKGYMKARPYVLSVRKWRCYSNISACKSLRVAPVVNKQVGSERSPIKLLVPPPRATYRLPPIVTCQLVSAFFFYFSDLYVRNLQNTFREEANKNNNVMCGSTSDSMLITSTHQVLTRVKFYGEAESVARSVFFFPIRLTYQNLRKWTFGPGCICFL
jgi:hypothetical protein